MPVKIIKCKCHHDFQDKTYGFGNRVHNETNKGWRCTVCLNDVKVGEVAKKEEKETKDASNSK